MIDIKKIDWEKLKNPGPPFKLFKMDEKDPIQFYRKLVRFKKLLMTKDRYLSDEFREEKYIDLMVDNYFSGMTFNVFYEIGDFQGLIGFLNILPDFKCRLTLKLWDREAWKKSLVRASRKLIDLYMKEFNLKRISTDTADKRVVKMAKMAGFKEEGKHPYMFRWKGKYYTLFSLGKLKER